MAKSERAIVWQPSSDLLEKSNLALFMRFAETRFNEKFPDFQSLYSWSVRNRNQFWQTLLEFSGIVAEGDRERVWAPSGEHPLWGIWFPSLRLNYAENLLRKGGSDPAIISWSEHGKRLTYSFDELRTKTAAVANFYSTCGLQPGDRVCAFVPNIAETVICMLATSACGGVWSSCSPDFGTQAALDRFSQISPKILVTADGYLHKGKRISVVDKIVEIAAKLPTVQKIVIIPFDETPAGLDIFGNRAVDYRKVAASPAPVKFERVKFSDPLFILFSSGTTGKPKCIVHSVGGTLLEHVKELALHSNMVEGERVFYQTTCGWMMWNFLVSGLALGASIVLYDGSPLHEDGKILWRMAKEESIALFGTNAKYIATLEKEGIKPIELFDYPKLTRVLSTGSPLTEQSFDFLLNSVKAGVQISSVSGGTDIVGCFALGSPISVVRRGELQVRSLGMDVQVFDQSGRSIVDEVGELVCCNSFPSMPVNFFGDPQKKLFRKAYFEEFQGVWHHGDFAELTSGGGMRILGRSDSTLNPGGIRIGTAELYQQVDGFPEILESLAVSYDIDGDSKIVLFVRMVDGAKLSKQLISQIRTKIKANISPFHVPWRIIDAPDFPRTRNGKVMESCVRRLLRGESVVAMVDAMLDPSVTVFFDSWRKSSKDEI